MVVLPLKDKVTLVNEFAVERGRGLFMFSLYCGELAEMADCTCLENMRTLTSSVGSNPTLSDIGI